MNKTILVIGSVTAKQYEQARLHCLREGHSPKIVRATESEIGLSKEELLSLYGSEDGSVLDTNSSEWMRLFKESGYTNAVIARAVARHLRQYGDIVAIVVSDDLYDMVGLQNCTVSRYAGPGFDDVPLWRVHEQFVEFMP